MMMTTTTIKKIRCSPMVITFFVREQQGEYVSQAFSRIFVYQITNKEVLVLIQYIKHVGNFPCLNYNQNQAKKDMSS